MPCALPRDIEADIRAALFDRRSFGNQLPIADARLVGKPDSVLIGTRKWRSIAIRKPPRACKWISLAVRLPAIDGRAFRPQGRANAPRGEIVLTHYPAISKGHPVALFDRRSSGKDSLLTIRPPLGNPAPARFRLPERASRAKALGRSWLDHRGSDEQADIAGALFDRSLPSKRQSPKRSNAHLR